MNNDRQKELVSKLNNLLDRQELANKNIKMFERLAQKWITEYKRIDREINILDEKLSGIETNDNIYYD